MHFMPGTIVNDQFEICAELGSGGNGVVYSARQVLLDRMVALKLLHSNSIKNLQRFKTEAKVLTKLRHQNIVSFIGYGATADFTYLVMELAQGTTLDELLSQGALPPAKTVQLMLQLCSALAYIHEHDVVHRDLKPGNIVVLPSGDLKLIDFGIAKMLDNDDQKLTSSGSLLGSASYMSPEQCSGSAVDGRADIYAVGAILYECLSGNKVFDGESSLHVMQKHLYEDVRKLSFATGLPLSGSDQSALTKIVMRCLAKDPNRRFSSALELQEQLAELQLTDDQPSPDRSTGPAARKASKPVTPYAVTVATITFLGLLAWNILAPASHRLNSVSALKKHAPVDVDRLKKDLCNKVYVTPNEIAELQLSLHEPGRRYVLTLAGYETDEEINKCLASDSFDQVDLRDRNLRDIKFPVLKKLKFLHLRHCQLTSLELKRVMEALPGLTELDLTRSQLSVDCVNIINGKNELQSLNLALTNITPSFLRQLKLPNLRRLSLEGNPELKDQKCFNNLNGLTSLNISSTGFNRVDKDFGRLRLTELYIKNTQLDDEACKSISSINCLEKLDVAQCSKISPQALSNLINNVPLTAVSLSFDQVKPEVRDALSRSRSIVAIDISNVPPGEANLQKALAQPSKHIRLLNYNPASNELEKLYPLSLLHDDKPPKEEPAVLRIIANELEQTSPTSTLGRAYVCLAMMQSAPIMQTSFYLRAINQTELLYEDQLNAPLLRARRAEFVDYLRKSARTAELKGYLLYMLKDPKGSPDWQQAQWLAEVAILHTDGAPARIYIRHAIPRICKGTGKEDEYELTEAAISVMNVAYKYKMKREIEQILEHAIKYGKSKLWQGAGEYYLGQLAGESKNASSAKEHLLKSFALFSAEGSGTTKDDWMFDNAIALGRQLREGHDFPQSQKFYNIAISLNRRPAVLPALLCDLATTQFWARDLTQAKATYRKAFELHKRNPSQTNLENWRYQNYATVLEDLGEYKSAIEILQLAVKSYPQNTVFQKSIETDIARLKAKQESAR